MHLDAGAYAALNRLLDEALALPEPDRLAWTERLPPEYDALKPRLLSLLRAGARGSPLDRPAVEADGGTVPGGEEGQAGPELRPGDRFGRYELRGLLGTGGMGRVYRAFDPSLAREVAIKTLPAALRLDPDSLRRVTREARLLATVTHPNIAAIYGFEEIDGRPCMVLELVEGETLATRLERGALPVGEAVAIALQVASALEEAHRRGVVHRDLKPANVKVSREGQVKVLDFGIARSLPGSPGAESVQAVVDTGAAGLVMGTAPYMSPEQIRGEPADPLTDVWAFGCLLHELLCGERLFQGGSTAEILAAVQREPLRWERLPPETPAALRRLLRRCLVRERRGRLQAVGDARLELLEAEREGAPDPTTEPAPVARRRTLPWVVAAAGLAAGLVVGLVVGLGRTGAPPVAPVAARLSLELPSGLALAGGYAPPFAISPDGRSIALVVLKDGVRHVGVRSLDSLEVKVLEGTEEGWQPTFSPDGKDIAFFAERRLKTVPAAGGPVITVAEIGENARGASWTRDDTIVFAPSQVSGLCVVPARGGAVTELTHLDPARGESSHRWPQALAGGRLVLFTTGLDTASFDEARVEVLSPATGARRVLVEGGAFGRYAAGQLFYAQAGRLFAVPFDAERGTVLGKPAPTIEEIRYDPRNGGTHLAVSEGGVLLYAPGHASPPDHHLAWVDASGRLARVGGPPRRFREPRLSPDGRRAAVVVGPAADADLWIVDVETGALTRATFGLAPHRPIWTPDGRGITVGVERGGRWRLLTVPAVGSGTPETLVESDHRLYPSDWAADGRSLVFEERRPDTDWDIRSVPTTAEGKPAGAPRDLVATPFQERNASLSPDGRLIAYESNEMDGVNGVFVAPTADPGAKARATPTFANWPRWGSDGTLYYWYPAQARPGDSGDAEGLYRIGGRALASPASAARPGPVWPGGPEARRAVERLILGPATGFDVDPAGGGRRFLFVETSAARLDVPLAGPVLVLGWSPPRPGEGPR